MSISNSAIIILGASGDPAKRKLIPALAKLYEKGDILPNIIVFKIQPAEGIILDVTNKIPGSDIRITNTNTNFCYRDSFSQEIPEAYQRLLLDALKGDQTLFVSSEENELSWKKIGDFLDKGEVKIYQKGTAPESSFDIEWIDFEKYCPVCS